MSETIENVQFKFKWKLCFDEFSNEYKLTKILSCGCTFCTECLQTYIELEIFKGVYEISCPDGNCPLGGIFTVTEISQLTSVQNVEKHHRYRLNREVELDEARCWCPSPGCETICCIPSSSTNQKLSHACSVNCPSCNLEFCSSCKEKWHPKITCNENSKHLEESDLLPLLNSDIIKMCPKCTIPIEKNEGCAEMKCKFCKHEFCWHCMQSLDENLLGSHYMEGPCKGKFGNTHPRLVLFYLLLFLIFFMSRNLFYPLLLELILMLFQERNFFGLEHRFIIIWILVLLHALNLDENESQ